MQAISIAFDSPVSVTGEKQCAIIMFHNQPLPLVHKSLLDFTF